MPDRIATGLNVEIKIPDWADALTVERDVLLRRTAMESKVLQKGEKLMMRTLDPGLLEPGLAEARAQFEARTLDLRRQMEQAELLNARERMISLPARAELLATLVDDLNTLIAWERRVYGLDPDPPAPRKAGAVTHKRSSGK